MLKYKVCMIVPNAVRGDSRVIKTAEALQKNGYDVHLFGMNRKPEVEIINDYSFKVTLASNPGQRMRQDKVYFDEDKNMNNNVFVSYLADSILESIVDQQFNFLHTHDMYGLPVGALIRERNKKIGTLGWIHDVHEYVEGSTHLPEFKRLACLDFERKYINLPDVRTTVSPILAKIISMNYGVAEPSLVLNTPKLADFNVNYSKTIREALGLNNNQYLLVYCGNVKPERGVDYVIKALPLVPDVNLALLSDPETPYMAELMELAKSLNVSDRVYIHPYVPNSDVSSFLQSANAGVRPSKQYPNADLALDTKLFEYMHAGLPVVSSATTAISDFVNTYKCGTLFSIGDIEQLAEAIGEVRKLFPVGLKNVAEGSEIAKKYSWEQQELNIIQSYELILKNLVVDTKINKYKYYERLLFEDFYIYHQGQGNENLKIGRAKQAFENYKRALELNPKDVGSIIGLSKLILQQADSEYLELLNKAIQDCLLAMGETKDCFELFPLVSIVNKRIMTAQNKFERNKNVEKIPKVRLQKDGITKFVLLICVWKRPELTKAVLDYYAQVKRSLEGKIKLELIAIGSEGETSKKICEEAGFDYFEYPNQPLSDKWEYGLNKTKEYDPDGVIIMGSDDLVSENLFLFYAECLNRGNTFVGLIDAYFYDLRTNTMIYWKGYGGQSVTKGKPHRLGETIGMARLLSRPLLEELGYSIWKGANISRGLDRYMFEKVNKIGSLPVRDCNRVEYLQEGDIYWGQVAYKMSDINVVAVDIKYQESVTQFESYLRNLSSFEKVENIDQFINKWIPQETYQVLQKLKNFLELPVGPMKVFR